ncbi:hypothetical protein IC611_06970 [Proteus mirabilis]
MGQVLFVVWRESFEALLVVGIIYAWIKRSPTPKQGMKYLWGSNSRNITLYSFSS